MKLTPEEIRALLPLLRPNVKIEIILHTDTATEAVDPPHSDGRSTAWTPERKEKAKSTWTPERRREHAERIRAGLDKSYDASRIDAEQVELIRKAKQQHNEEVK